MATIDDLELPEKPKLSDRTREWFEAWKKDPRTQSWGEAECQFLLDTALIHSFVWGAGRVDLAHELFLREREMGLLFEQPKVAKKETKKASVLSLVINDREQKAKRAANER